jgi:hypothetical protein
MRRLSPLLLALLSACNQAPPAAELTLEPAAPTTGDALTLTVVQGADPDGDPLTTSIAWFLDGDPQGEHRGADSIPAEATAKGQVWRAYAVPSDGALEGPARSVEVTILNTPPSVVHLGFDPPAPLATDTVEAVVETEDADHDELSLVYLWTREGDGATHSAAVLDVDDLARGQRWTLEVTPADDEVDGEPARAVVDIENSPPTITSVSLEPTDPTVETTITASAEGDDVDGDAVSFAWAWYVDGALVEGQTEPSLSGEHFAKHQQVQVRVTPHDGFVDGAPELSWAVEVLNSPPSIGGAVIEPSEIREADLADCAIQGWSDPDGDPEGFDRVWLVNGVAISGKVLTEEGGLTGDYFSEGDRIQCQATPTDGEDQGSPQLSDPVTVLNTPPVLASVTIAPSSPVEGDSITPSLGALTDVDGDPTTVSYAWFVDGVEVSTETSIDSSLFDKHQAIHLVVTPWDDDEPGAAVTSNTATAVNTPPEITSLALTPSALYTDDTVAASVSTTDADGDAVSLSYAWSVDGVATSETGSSLDGASWFDKHQSVSVVVTPNDGEEDGGDESASVAVLNSPPSAPVLRIDPEEPEAAVDDLVCSIVTEPVDPDGDSWDVSFAWTVDGVPFTGATTTAAADDTVLGESTYDDEVWTCRVEVEDSEGASAAAEVIVTAQFTAEPEVALGCEFACSLDRYGHIECWGRDNWGQASPPSGVFVALDANCYHACAIDNGGSLNCWGKHVAGFNDPITSCVDLATGYEGFCVLQSDSSLRCMGWNLYGNHTAPTGTFQKAFGGDDHYCALTTGGTIECWGLDDDGQASPPSGVFVDIGAGGAHNCALDAGGTMQCWGRNLPSTATAQSGTFLDVAGGTYHNCAIEAGGALLCWGYDDDGQSSPPSGTFISVSASNNSSCALDTDEYVHCWGDNSYGQTTVPPPRAPP